MHMHFLAAVTYVIAFLLVFFAALFEKSNGLLNPPTINQKQNKADNTPYNLRHRVHIF